MAYHWLSKSILLEQMGFEEAAIDRAVEEHLADLQDVYNEAQ